MMMNQGLQMKTQINPRYKTSLCKNYNSDHGCQYGDKCQFAHGSEELRVCPNIRNVPGMIKPIQKVQKNILNYKIVKCKNFEREGKCKYGDHCSFAHGDQELRVKPNFNPALGMPFDPYNQMNMGMNMGMGMMPYTMDYQNQMMAQNQMMMMGNDGNMYMMPQQNINNQIPPQQNINNQPNIQFNQSQQFSFLQIPQTNLAPNYSIFQTSNPPATTNSNKTTGNFSFGNAPNFIMENNKNYQSDLEKQFKEKGVIQIEQRPKFPSKKIQNQDAPNMFSNNNQTLGMGSNGNDNPVGGAVFPSNMGYGSQSQTKPMFFPKIVVKGFSIKAFSSFISTKM